MNCIRRAYPTTIVRGSLRVQSVRRSHVFSGSLRRGEKKGFDGVCNSGTDRDATGMRRVNRVSPAGFDVAPAAPCTRPCVGFPSVQEVNEETDEGCDEGSGPEVRGIVEEVDGGDQHAPLDQAEPYRLAARGKRDAQFSFDRV